MSAKVYEMVTEKIITQLENGIIPWRRTWSAGGLPKNAVTKKEYRGMNMFLLGDYACPFWGSFKQINDLGGSVLKGEKSSLCVFWKLFDVEDELDENGKPKKIPMLRYYNVWNISQTTLADDPRFSFDTEKNDKIAEAEWIIANMPNRPSLEKKFEKAFYNTVFDCVNVPDIKYFKDADSYYSIMFHELAHSTGHKSRLDRETVTEAAAFGSETYSKEELVAEMGSAFISASCGIVNSTLENSAAYIGNWLHKLKDDKRMIVFAAAAAQKAADYILGKNQEEAKAEEVA